MCYNKVNIADKKVNVQSCDTKKRVNWTVPLSQALIFIYSYTYKLYGDCEPISCHWSLSIPPPENIRKPDDF